MLEPIHFQCYKNKSMHVYHVAYENFIVEIFGFTSRVGSIYIGFTYNSGFYQHILSRARRGGSAAYIFEIKEGCNNTCMQS